VSLLNQYTSFPDECRIVPKQMIPQELEVISRRLCATSNITLIVEEMEQFIPQGKPILPYTSMLIRMGRNWGIGVWGTTRRIQQINKEFFDLCQHCFFFRCGLKSRDYIANMIGGEYVYMPAQPNYNTTGYAVTTLPPFHTMHFNLEDESARVMVLKMPDSPRERIIEVPKGKATPADEPEPLPENTERVIWKPKGR